MPEMQQKKINKKIKLGVTTLLNYQILVIVAVVGFRLYSWRKMKAFRPLEGRRCGENQFEWIHLVN